MDPQVGYTILGGLLSGLVGVSLFFLQRCKAGRDEQRRVLFQVYQLMVLPPPPVSTEDPFARASIQSAADEVRLMEIGSLPVRIKDKVLAAEVCRYPKMSQAERNALVDEIIRRLHPKLVDLIEKRRAAASAGKQKET